MLLNLVGTLLSSFSIGKGTSQVSLRSNSGTLQALNYGGSWQNVLGQGGGFSVVAISNTDHSLSSSESFSRVTTGSSNRTITLPTASSASGKEFIIKKVDSGSGTVIVSGNGSETLDGSNTKTISGQYAYIRLISNGSSWDIVSTAMWS